MKQIKNNHLKPEWPFLVREHFVEITLAYEHEQIKDTFENWVLEGEAGNYYTIYNAVAKPMQHSTKT